MESSTLHELIQHRDVLKEAHDSSLKRFKNLYAQRRFLKRERELLRIRLEASAGAEEREVLQGQLADLDEALAIRLQVLNESYRPVLQLERQLQELEAQMAAISASRPPAPLHPLSFLSQLKAVLQRLGMSPGKGKRRASEA